MLGPIHINDNYGIKVLTDRLTCPNAFDAHMMAIAVLYLLIYTNTDIANPSIRFATVPERHSPHSVR